jgi:hypothetical protein
VESSWVVYVRWAVDWAALEEMQDFAGKYCHRRYGADLGDRARLAVHELLENAVRYALSGSEVAFALRDIDAGFEARVENDSVESRISLLRKHIQEVQSPNPAEVYQRALRKLLTDSPDGIGGGLGLLRARNEANVDLALEVSGRRVTMIATGSGLAATPARASWARRGSEKMTPSQGAGERNGKLR